ncbi:MAG: hypothetical protein MI862_08600 [Desulfobacterales bacterium]|nr:hypothetical protein [Desulfobacterales bacterium]
MQDIHGIRPPVTVGIDPALITYAYMALAGLLLLIVLAYLIQKWRKKRTNPVDLEGVAMPPPPYDAAVQALEALAVQPTDDLRTFYFQLHLILRQYIGRQFGIGSVEMTSQEFLRSLRRLDIDTRSKTRIILFQEHCDPIKYAGAHPDRVTAQSDLNTIRQIIDGLEAGRNEKSQAVSADQGEKP